MDDTNNTNQKYNVSIEARMNEDANETRPNNKAKQQTQPQQPPPSIRNTRNNHNTLFILAITENRNKEVGIAAYNLRDAQFTLSQFVDTQTYIHTYTKLHIYEPHEIVIPESNIESEIGRFVKNSSASLGTKIIPLHRKYFSETTGELLIKQLVIPEGRSSVELERGTKYLAFAALAALVRYVEFIQNINLADASFNMVFTGKEGSVIIDAETVKNLELISNLRTGSRFHSLFGILNNTKTSQGQRMLISNLVQPPADLNTINMRLDAISELLEDEKLYFGITSVLSGFLDINHLLSQLVQIPRKTDASSSYIKLSHTTITNVILLKHTIDLLPSLTLILQRSKNPLLQAIYNNFSHSAFDEIRSDIEKIINEDTRHSKSAAHMQTQLFFAVKPSINGMLDVARKTYTEVIEDIHQLLRNYQEQYDLPNLRLQQNAKRGYFLSIPSQSSTGLPHIFIQTTISGKKLVFSTEELNGLSAKNRESQQEILSLTNVVVAELMDRVRKHMGALYKLAESLALLDMLQSFATYVTLSEGCVRPEFTLDGPIVIKQGRHPIVERIFATETFVPNDTFLSETCNFQIITAPNMAGKSTYLRQNALLSIMAHIGCFVPAQFASFRIIDRLLTRIGTSDSIEANCSCFMSEMREMNFILQNATHKSLVIIDELGRGTSNKDGVAIAFAVCEQLASRFGCFTLFSTHYHELTVLETLYPNIKNYHLKVERPSNVDTSISEDGLSLERIQDFANSINSRMRFTYSVSEGRTKEVRYGIDIASLSGFPHDIIENSRKICKELEYDSIFQNLDVSASSKTTNSYYSLAQKLLLLKYSTLKEDGLRNYLNMLKGTYISK